MPEDLKIEKKKQKQTNKRTKTKRLSIGLRAASKHVPVVQKMAMCGAIYQGHRSYLPGPSDKLLPSG